MPVVYDKNYGRAHQFEVMETDFTNGEAVAAGVSDSRASLTWLDRSGGSRLFKRFRAMSSSVSSRWRALATGRCS